MGSGRPPIYHEKAAASHPTTQGLNRRRIYADLYDSLSKPMSSTDNQTTMQDPNVSINKSHVQDEHIARGMSFDIGSSAAVSRDNDQ